MKKSPFILALSLAAILTLTGCGNNVTSESAVINKLSHEVDRAINSVNIVTETYSKLPVSEVSKIFSSTSSPKITKLSNINQNISSISSNSNAKRTQLLQKAKNVKRMIAGGLTLGEQNANALNELTSAMQRYTTALNRTRSDYNNTIKSLSKFNNVASNEVDAKFTRLNCCMQAREVYINNLISTLDNIEQIIMEIDSDSSQPEISEGVMPEPNKDINSSNEGNDEGVMTLPNNDKDTIMPVPEGVTPELEGVTPILEGFKPILEGFKPELDNDIAQQDSENNGIMPEGIIPSNQSALPFNNFNGGYGANNGYGYNGYGANGFNGYGANGYDVNGYGVNNGYNNYYNHNGFNPNRNTDTYGPIVRNIDTYRTGFRPGVTPLLDEKDNEKLCDECKHDDINLLINKKEGNEPIIKIEEKNEGVTPVLNEDKCENCNKDETKQSHDDEIMTLPLKDFKPILEKQNEGNLPVLENKDKDICEECKDEGVSPASTEQIEGEDKVKGHTQTANIFDINQNIEKLIKE